MEIPKSFKTALNKQDKQEEKERLQEIREEQDEKKQRKLFRQKENSGVECQKAFQTMNVSRYRLHVPRL